MNQEHLKELERARTELIQQRRLIVKALAQPSERGRDTEGLMKTLVEYQTTIDALDRAREDEQKGLPPGIA